MNRHAVRGVVVAWFSLIVLQAVGKAGASGRVGSLFSDAQGLVTRALSPNVPLIPDRRTMAGSLNDGANAQPPFGSTPAAAAAGAAVARNAPAVGVLTNPNGLFGNNLSQYATGGGLHNRPQ